MNPNPAQITLIRQFVAGLSGGWAGNTDTQIRTAMASAKVANPTPQVAVPKPFGASDLVNACSAPNRPNLGPYLIGAAGLIIAQDAAHLAAAIDAMPAVGVISTADATAMNAVLSATIPDPSWTATVSWDTANLGRAADDFDIEAARKGQ